VVLLTRTRSRTRFPASILALTVTTLTLPVGPPLRAQTPNDCSDPNAATPETSGPTDISAVSGNQRLSVALNPDATVTVFKWPSPSYYDQIKYRTTDRRERFKGALPNEGAFLGIAWKPDTDGKGWGFDWLRQWSSRQRFTDPDTDEVLTIFRNRRVGLTVTVKDVVAPFQDVLVRDVSVARTRSSTARRVRIFAFSNYNPVFSKTQQAPVSDWCTEESNDAGAEYVRGDDLIMHVRSGIDESTSEASSIAVALALGSNSDGHQVGQDTYETPGSGLSAYDDSANGRLQGSDESTGQSDGVLYEQLSLGQSRRGRVRVIMAAAADAKNATSLIEGARDRSYDRLAAEKRAWWRAWLRGARVPAGAPNVIARLATRSLISIRQATDAGSGMVVASIATQSPYGVDWIRDGAYVNEALHRAGHPEMVEKHDVRYGELQATATSKPPGGMTTPSGNWSQNFYADGVVGGSIPYEIDETGLGIWTLWDHYAETADRDYLISADVYESIQRAAHYLTDDTPIGCRDPATGLQCTANEEDDPNLSRTLIGAQAAWLGVTSAAKAARVRGGAAAETNAARWEGRADQLRAAIRQNFFDETCTCYTRDHQTGGTFLWPIGFVPRRSKAADGQAEENWRHISRVLRGKEDRGELEVRALLGNSYVWKSGTGLRRVKKGLRWVATKPTTNETGLLGRAWMIFPPNKRGRLTTMVSQPHVWSHAMFYLASLQAYGSKPWRDSD
jgi:GH15 family glucan-1,4-alpha-glucosidase